MFFLSLLSECQISSRNQQTSWTKASFLGFRSINSSWNTFLKGHTSNHNFTSWITTSWIITSWIMTSWIITSWINTQWRHQDVEFSSERVKMSPLILFFVTADFLNRKAGVCSECVQCVFSVCSVCVQYTLQVVRQRANDGVYKSVQFVQNAVLYLQLLPSSFNLKNTLPVIMTSHDISVPQKSIFSD